MNLPDLITKLSGYMFVIILSYTKPIEEIDILRPGHLEFLDKYYAKDIFLMSGRQTSLTGGVIIANAKSENEINLLIKEDPYHIHNVATYKIIEFDASKFNSKIGNLIAS